MPDACSPVTLSSMGYIWGLRTLYALDRGTYLRVALYIMESSDVKRPWLQSIVVYMELVAVKRIEIYPV